jgi:hypothetical protein
VILDFALDILIKLLKFLYTLPGGGGDGNNNPFTVFPKNIFGKISTQTFTLSIGIFPHKLGLDKNPYFMIWEMSPDLFGSCTTGIFHL